jgi:hypothetical protein
LKVRIAWSSSFLVLSFSEIVLYWCLY